MDQSKVSKNEMAAGTIVLLNCITARSPESEVTGKTHQVQVNGTALLRATPFTYTNLCRCRPVGVSSFPVNQHYNNHKRAKGKQHDPQPERRRVGRGEC